MSDLRIPLEWKEAGAATNRDPQRKCLKGFAPTLSETRMDRHGMFASPAHIATITPLPHGDSRRPRAKFFLQLGFRGRTGRAPGTLQTFTFKTLKAAKRKAEAEHAAIMAHEMEKFLQDEDSRVKILYPEEVDDE